MLDLHSEAWWIKALDGDLSPAEQVLWERHRAECDRCQAEWVALAQLDTLLASVALPQPPANFTAHTVTRLMTAQHRRRVWLLLSLSVLTLLVGGGIVLSLSAILSDLSRLIAAVMFSWDLLMETLLHIALSLMVSGRFLSPLIVLLAALLLLVFMPNGVLATVTVILLRRSH